MKKPPICPNCKKPLKIVWEIDYSRWVWNEKEGKYEQNIFDGELVAKCPYCNADISDLFEDGVCNFKR